MTENMHLQLHSVFDIIGVPEQFKKAYEKCGVTSLYQWQYDCLMSSGAISGKNLVYCAPTGGGKTMVAELIMLKTLLARKKKIIFVLPYVSLVKEKERHFKKLVHIYNCSLDKRSRLKVRGFHGDKSTLACFKCDILICTIEKSNMIVNSLVRQGYAHKLGCVVVDEMHCLGDCDRGYHLEILISKLKLLMIRHRMLSKDISNDTSMSDIRPDDNSFYDVHVQLVALSATVGNISALADWFGAALYQTSFRPVELTENISYGGNVFDQSGVLVKNLDIAKWNITAKQEINSNKEVFRPVVDELAALVWEGLSNGQQVIVFCSSRNGCQTVCKKISAVLPFMSYLKSVEKVGEGKPEETYTAYLQPLCHAGSKCSGETLTLTRIAIADNLLSSAIASAVGAGRGDQQELYHRDIKTDQSDVISVLCAGIRLGIAFHHAGLGDSYREAVENAYKSGHISVLICTSTLAAGVNLPAGRVIINGMKVGYSDTISVIQYRQMCGRAGRAGFSVSAAESFLLVRPNERNAALALSRAPYPCVVSQMSPDSTDGNKGFLRAVLELCSLSLCDSTETFNLYIEQTLFFQELVIANKIERPPHEALQALQFLLNAHILKVSKSQEIVNDVNISRQGHGLPVLEFGLTQFGLACVACNMNPDDAIIYYDDLLRARDNLNLETDLHVAYLCAPLYHSLLPNFGAIFNVMTSSTNLNPVQRVILAVGLDEGRLWRWTQSPPSSVEINGAVDILRQIKSNTGSIVSKRRGIDGKSFSKFNEESLWMIFRCKRLWAAQIIVDMLRTQDTSRVSAIYNVPVGDLEQLHKNATMLSGRMIEFTSKLGWTSLSQIMKNFTPRLKEIDNDDPSPNLVDLMSIPGLEARTAKILINSKLYDSCRSLASASAKDIAQCLRLSLSFDGTPSLADGNGMKSNTKPNRNIEQTKNADEVKKDDSLGNIGVPAHPASPSSNTAVQESVAVATPRLTRSASKKGKGIDLTNCQSEILEEPKTGENYSLSRSGRKRRRVSATLVRAMDESVKKSEGNSPIAYTNCDRPVLSENQVDVSAQGRAAAGGYQVKERHDTINKSLLALGEKLIQNAKAVLERRAAENTGEASPKALVNKYGILPDINDVESTYNSDESTNSTEDATDISSVGSLESIPENEQVLMLSDIQVEVEDQIPSDIDPHIAPWLRRAIDNGGQTKYIVAVSSKISAVASDKSLMEAADTTASRSQAMIESEQDWLNIPDEELCKMMNSAERRHSLRQKYHLQSAKRLQSGNKRDLYAAETAIAPETSFVDLITESAHQYQKIAPNYGSKADIYDPATAEVRQNKNEPHVQVSSPDEGEVFLDLQVPSDFFDDEYEEAGCRSENCGINVDNEAFNVPKESFLSPYTPSKVRSAQKYLSYELLNLSTKRQPDMLTDREESKPVLCSDVLNSHEGGADCAPSLGGPQNFRVFADLVDLASASAERCTEFLSLCKSCHCLCIELVYRRIPIGDNSQGVPIQFPLPSAQSKKYLQSYWGGFVVRRPTGISRAASKSKGAPHQSIYSTVVVSGVALSFQGNVAYFLPLPTPLPIHRFSSDRVGENVLPLRPDATNCPNSVKTLIARFVGVDGYINKCRNLTASFNDRMNIAPLRQNKSRDIPCRYDENAPNPLLSVSRSWNEACRRAMHEEWRRGKCTEWRIFNDMMTDEQTTKVGLYIKDQLTVLRERDILSNGFLEDPMIASQLLEIPESGLKMIDVFPNENRDLPLCQAVYRVSRYIQAKMDACIRVLKVLHKMAELEREIAAQNLMDLFLFVEMPLCKCVSEMEYTGMPFEASLFVNLKQDLSDRCKVIESYFKLLEGSDFNLSSEKHIANLRKRLGRSILNDVLAKRGLSSSFSGEKPVSDVVAKFFKVSSCRNEHSDEVSKEVAELMTTHPLIKLLSEWRSHHSAVISCSSILDSISSREKHKSAFSTRIHGIFNTIGTASGRMTVVKPPLQQMAHECIYRPSIRPSIYTEACQAAAEIRAPLQDGIDILSKRWLVRPQWVRFVPLIGIKSSTPFNFESGRLLELGQKTSHQTGIDCFEERQPTAEFLLAERRAHGQTYWDTREKSSFSVTLSVNLSRHEEEEHGSYGNLTFTPGKLTCVVPADKVFRLAAPLEPHDDELQEIFACLKRKDLGAPVVSKPSSEAPVQRIISPRSGFVASKGCVVMSVDYSQIELRILAHFCEDPTLLNSFREEKIDVFKGICSRWKKKNPDLVSEEERDAVKQLCYAIIYGAGAGRISAVAECSEAEAKFLYQDFLKCHPGISKFISAVKKESRKCGFVTTILGRRRQLHGINSESKSVQAKAERQAVNTVCQGSASDLIKLAMVNINCRLQAEFRGRDGAFRCRRTLPGGGLYKKMDDIRMILQIHDELLFEVPERYLDEVAKIVVDCMENALQLSVPLKVKVNVGNDWSTLKPLSIASNGEFGCIKTRKILNLHSGVVEHNQMIPHDSIQHLSSVSRSIFSRNDSLCNFEY